MIDEKWVEMLARAHFERVVSPYPAEWDDLASDNRNDRLSEAGWWLELMIAAGFSISRPGDEPFNLNQRRIDLIRAALACQLSELGPEGPHAADDACLRADLLALAAREHTRGVEASAADERPVGRES